MSVGHLAPQHARRRARACAVGDQAEALGPNGHLDLLALAGSRAASATGTGSPPADRDQAVAAAARTTRPGRRFTSPMKSATIRLAGPRVDLPRRALLERAAALVHDGDPVGQRHRLGLVVGDVHEGDAGPPLELLQLPAHPLPELRVEVGQRLVEQEDRRARPPGSGPAPRAAAGRRRARREALLEPCRGSRARARGPTRSPASARGTRRTSRPKATFSYTVLWGQIA